VATRSVLDTSSTKHDVTSLAFFDETSIIAAFHEGSPERIDLHTGTVIQTLPGITSPVGIDSAAVARGGRHVAIGSWKEIRLYQLVSD
jgi:hypothetical protein